MKIILTGSTGMVGKGVLLECLDDKRVQQVVAINRNPLSIQHPKLKEIIHPDFFDFTDLEAEFAHADACFHCMGVSSAGMNEADYHKLTYNISLALAKSCHKENPNMVFTYVSGTGTDSSEKGRVMWARVKGKTENDIIKLGFKKAYMFRPGVIQPKRGIVSSTPLYRAFYKWFGWIIPIMKAISKDSVTTTEAVGKAMINAVDHNNCAVLLHNADINKLAIKP